MRSNAIRNSIWFFLFFFTPSHGSGTRWQNQSEIALNRNPCLIRPNAHGTNCAHASFAFPYFYALASNKHKHAQRVVSVNHKQKQISSVFVRLQWERHFRLTQTTHSFKGHTAAGFHPTRKQCIDTFRNERQCGAIGLNVRTIDLSARREKRERERKNGFGTDAKND